EARGGREPARDVGGERGSQGRYGDDDTGEAGLRRRSRGRGRRRRDRERAQGRARAREAEGRDPRRRSSGGARRGRPRARAGEGGGRDGVRPGLRVIARALLLAALAVPTLRTAALGASLSELETRAKAFYNLLESGQKERAAAVAPELEKELQSSLQELQDRMDRMRDEVMDHDGDIEALYRESRWRDPEIASLVITYHLAWVRYQEAQLTTDA